MKKIEFTSLSLAVEHGSKFGGWIFVSNDQNIIIWYNAEHYTPSTILKDVPCSGSIKPWRIFEQQI